MRGRADGARIAAGVAFAVGLYLLAFVFANSPYVLFAMTLTLCYAIPAMALNLLLGYTGLVSLGHMGFAGAGAYITAFLMKKGLAPFPLIQRLILWSTKRRGISTLRLITFFNISGRFFDQLE